jgi:integrase
MLAIDLLNRYVREHPYGVADATAAQLRYTLGSYIRFCGTCGLQILDCDRANQWIDELRQSRAPDTVRTQRTNLLCVWWWAYRERLVDEPPLRLRRLRPISRSPQAWTLDEIHALIAAAEAYPCRSQWTATLVRVGYDTGLRLGDLLRLRLVDVLAGHLAVVQGKTCRVVHVQLRDVTREALQRFTSGQPPPALVWPLWGRREAFYRHFRRVVEASGIRPGTFRWLRRTAATQLERVSPGRGTELLGHASRATTEAWYLDRSQLSDPPLPPL